MRDGFQAGAVARDLTRLVMESEAEVLPNEVCFTLYDQSIPVYLNLLKIYTLPFKY